MKDKYTIEVDKWIYNLIRNISQDLNFENNETIYALAGLISLHENKFLSGPDDELYYKLRAGFYLFKSAVISCKKDEKVNDEETSNNHDDKPKINKRKNIKVVK
jgi:hypothetical protein